MTHTEHKHSSRKLVSPNAPHASTTATTNSPPTSPTEDIVPPEEQLFTVVPGKQRLELWSSAVVCVCAFGFIVSVGLVVYTKECTPAALPLAIVCFIGEWLGTVFAWVVCGVCMQRVDRTYAY